MNCEVTWNICRKYSQTITRKANQTGGRIMKGTRFLKYYLWWAKLDLNLKTKFVCPTLTCNNNQINKNINLK